MMRDPHIARLSSLALAGVACRCAAAPSITVAGAYFPAWLACALIGVIVALMTRGVLVAGHWAQALPLQLLVCTSVGVIAAVLAWIAWIGA